MTTDNDSLAPPLTGRMFLYQRPVLLTREEHGSLGLSRNERPYDFCETARAIPLTAAEFSSAQKAYPIVFSELENPVPLAVTGLSEDANLFVRADGRWENLCYVPAYIRCYPFAFASQPGDQLAVVIDRQSSMISENPTQPFFDGAKLAEGTQAMVDFCTQYDAERRQTQQFCQRLKELGLLAPQQASHKQPGQEDQPIANYVAVDTKKLQELEDGVVSELFRNGALAVIMAHLFSLENWQRLVERRHIRASQSESRPAP